MSKNGRRRLTAEDKLRVVTEGRQSGMTISDVCRQYQIYHTQFYRWERQAKQGALELLRNGGKGARPGKNEKQFAAEITRLRTVIAELSSENLALKKGDWV